MYQSLRALVATAVVGLALSTSLASVPAQGATPGMVFAVIGDYGCQPGTDCPAISSQQEIPVANMVHSWNPAAIWTVGDNSYENATATDVPLDQQPYAADVQAGRFYPIIGNHDWLTNPDTPTLNYFHRPNHYVAHFGGGLVDLFATDMNGQDPDGDGATSAQANQYRADVGASTAIWKITADHQAFYSSGQHGTFVYTHWAILPVIDLFLSGHDHDMEHLTYQGKNFVVDGVGGKNLYGFAGHPACPFTSATGVAPCPATTVWRDSTTPHFGAVRLTITPTTLLVEYVALGGTVLHSFALSKNGTAPTPMPSSPAPTPSAPAPSPTPNPSAPPQAGGAFPLRAAFYYPWFPEAWNQQGLNPFTKYHPSLGFYDSSSSAVIRQQIGAMQYANIRAGISSWWGQGSRTDSRVPLLLSNATGTGFQWTLYYEQEALSDPSVSQINADLAYIKSHYASSPSYLHINGKFVIFVYADPADGCGMADRWKQANTVGAYVVLKVFPGYGACASQPDGWHQYSPAVASDSQPGHSFAISPGFYKANETAPRLARDPNVWSANIRAMIASRAPFQLITTFSEWGEGTATESATEWATPSGFGTYLDALHNNGGLGPSATPPAPTPVPTGSAGASPAPSGSAAGQGSGASAPQVVQGAAHAVQKAAGQVVHTLVAVPPAIVHAAAGAVGRATKAAGNVLRMLLLPLVILLAALLVWTLLRGAARQRGRARVPIG